MTLQAPYTKPPPPWDSSPAAADSSESSACQHPLGHVCLCLSRGLYFQPKLQTGTAPGGGTKDKCPRPLL